ncbi:DNA alkylation damage repair protein [Phaffia rhodozyma]|uniref:DNA alkylation damage repair protein n=1 Tax=Phaffia rhodozyma TaxID=264483 RepID=A0A0F7SFL0_PHARH|nr:DNA alkylation damage repair protein [Phaffia rhodozyma]
MSTPFRLSEKHFKARSDPSPCGRKKSSNRRPKTIFRPSLEDVFDPRRLLDSTRHQPGDLDQAGWTEARREDVECVSVGKGKVDAWAVVGMPGLVILPGYFSPERQRLLVKSCLQIHTQPPNKTNLDTHFHLPPSPLFPSSPLSDDGCKTPSSSLWSLYTSSLHSHPPEDPLVPTRASSLEDDSSSEEGSKQKFVRIPPTRTLIENLPGEDFLNTVASDGKREILPVEPSKTVRPKPISKLIRELRWTNIGLFYDWTSKSYDFDTPIPFPDDIDMISRQIVSKDIDWSLVYGSLGVDGTPSSKDENGMELERVKWEQWNDYKPDAGIINFYQPDDTLMAHVDRSELDAHRPLVSVSLGLSAVFLLGTSSRDTPPLPILLRSGDVVVLSGHGRRAYHGVPRILDDTLPAHLKPSLPEDQVSPSWDEDLGRYMETTRININARQVFPPGFKRP